MTTRDDFDSLIKLAEQYESDLHSLNVSWRQAQERLNKSFRAKWFIHRAVIPVAIVSGVHSDRILSDILIREVSNPRALVMWIAYQTGNIGYSSMGRIMNRDHSTVRHAIQVAGDNIAAKSGSMYTMFVDVCDLEDQWH